MLSKATVGNLVSVDFVVVNKWPPTFRRTISRDVGDVKTISAQL